MKLTDIPEAGDELLSRESNVRRVCLLRWALRSILPVLRGGILARVDSRAMLMEQEKRQRWRVSDCVCDASAQLKQWHKNIKNRGPYLAQLQIN